MIQNILALFEIGESNVLKTKEIVLTEECVGVCCKAMTRKELQVRENITPDMWFLRFFVDRIAVA